MPYVTQQDLIDRLGEDEVYILADRDRDGTLDDGAIEGAAADAAAEIDAYVGTRYAVPLADPVPRVIQRVAVDITVYRLADIGGIGGIEARRQRYEDAISLLKRIAAGDVTLGVGDDSGDGDAPGEIVGDQILDAASPERLFGRRKHTGWPA